MKKLLFVSAAILIVLLFFAFNEHGVEGTFKIIFEKITVLLEKLIKKLI